MRIPKKLTKEQNEIMKVALRLMKKSTSGFPSLLDFATERITRSNIRTQFENLSTLEQLVYHFHQKEYETCIAAEMAEDTKTSLVERIAEIVVSLSRWPTIEELKEYDITRDSIQHHFGSWSGCQNYIKENHNDLIIELFSSAEFTPSRFKQVVKAAKKSDTFLVSTVMSGCAINEEALKAADTFSTAEEAISLFQPIADPARPRQGQEMFFDTKLRERLIVYNDLSLNNKVKLLSLLYSAKRINPHDRAKRFTDNESLSFIASPRRRLTPIANMADYPGYLFSPGSICNADYSTEMYMSNGLAYEAEKKHFLGAGVVKILGPNRYFFSNVTFDKETGAFTFLNRRYHADGAVRDDNAKYVVLGDFHAQTVDRSAFDRAVQLVSWLQPKTLFLHDVDTCLSVNPFDKNSPIKQWHNRKEVWNIEAGIKDLIEKLLVMSRHVKDLYIVESNHEAFYEFYVQGGRYCKDVENLDVGHLMALWKIKDAGCNLLEKLISHYDANKLLKGKLTFLKSTESFKVNGVECSQHGHVGAGGRKSPNLDILAQQLGPCNVGHAHRSEISGDAMRVGTLEGIAKNRPSYARKGPNDWSQSLIIGNESGDRQLLHLCNIDAIAKYMEK